MVVVVSGLVDRAQSSCTPQGRLAPSVILTGSPPCQEQHPCPRRNGRSRSASTILAHQELLRPEERRFEQSSVFDIDPPRPS